jgi:hypothetical protein
LTLLLFFLQNQQATNAGSANQSSSTPSSGAYVDISSTAKLPRGVAVSVTTVNVSGDQRLARAAPLKSRTIALSASTSAGTRNGPLATEVETGYVVDSEKGNAYFKGQLLGKVCLFTVYTETCLMFGSPS